MDTAIAQTPKIWESCANPKTTYSIIVDGCWKSPKFQTAGFQGLVFLMFDQCSMMYYWSDGSNPLFSASSSGSEFRSQTQDVDLAVLVSQKCNLNR